MLRWMQVWSGWMRFEIVSMPFRPSAWTQHKWGWIIDTKTTCGIFQMRATLALRALQSFRMHRADLEKIHIILARLAEDTPFFILLFIICEWKTEIIWLLICVFTIPNDKLAAGCRECLSFPQKYVKSFFGFFVGDDICFDNGKLWSYKGDRANQNFENSCKALR